MYTSDYCSGCEKFEVIFETRNHVNSFNDVPNTFDFRTGKYTWQFNEVVGFLLIPRSISGLSARVDMYLCVDEHDAQTLDIFGYVSSFLKQHILPKWSVVRKAHLSSPVSGTPEGIVCRRAKQLKHARSAR